jgi:hypothetical protein
MPFVRVGTENSAEIHIHYNDHRTGRPIVLGPHNIGWTHPDEVNAALPDFLA